MRKIMMFLPLVIFIALGIIFYKQLGSDPEYMPSALIGKPVPNFQLSDLHSKQMVTQADLPKKPYLINFWATWCPSCDIEYPYLMTLAQKGVTIIGIDYKDHEAKAMDWLKEKGNPYQSVIADTDGQLGVNMGVTGAPETFVVNSKGIIVYRYQGVLDDAAWGQIKEHMQ